MMYFHLALNFYMRSVFFLISCLLSTILFGQKPFEGTINYNLHATGEKEDAQMSVSFSPSIIKIVFKEKGKEPKDYMLVNLDSGKVFTLSIEGKTYQEKNLVKREKKAALIGETIAGYQTTAIDLDGLGFNGLLRGLSSGNIVFYKAENLVFPVPAYYNGNTELVFIQDNKIVLGADFSMSSPMDEDTVKDLITVRATDVISKPIDKNEFLIPNGFTKMEQLHYTDSTTMTDNADYDTTTIVTVPPPSKVKKEVKKSKPATPKKTSGTKPAAVKRKQD